MKSRFFRGLLAAVSFTLLVPVVGFAATIASDKASDPAYSGGWTNGSNGGVGWGTNTANAWLLTIGATLGTNTPTTHFISSSTSNNTNGDTNADGDINSAGVAWGMASNGQDVGAARFFDGALSNGQKFVIEMDNGTIPPGGTEVGFILGNTAAQDRLSFLLKSNSATYEIVGAGSLNTGITNTDQGLRIVFEQVSADTGNVFVTRLVDGSNFVFNAVLLETNVATHNIAALSLIDHSRGGTATNRLFFNSISILPNPADTNLFADVALTKTNSLEPAIVGSNLTYTVTVTNKGPANAIAVTITDVPPAGISLVANPSQGTCTNFGGQFIWDVGVLTNNTKAFVTLVGAPASVGVLTNTAVVTALNVDPNPTNNVVTNFVTVVSAAQLSVSPASFNFGTIATGTSSQTTFVVTNSGGSTLTGIVTVAGVDFVVTNGSPFSVAGFGSANVGVSFTPASEGDFSNDVIFVSNGGVSTNIVRGSGAIVPTANFTGAPTVGAASLLVTFTNTSTGTITNQLWSFGDSGTSSSSNPSHSYANAGTFSVSLTVFGPLDSNTFTRSNYITVTNVFPQLTVTPASRSFGGQLVGTVSTQSFSVINSGLSTLTGTVTVSGPRFALLSGGTFSLSAAQTGTVAVTFSPTNTGAFAGSAIFASNGGVSTNAVTGTGATLPVAGFTGSPTTGSVSLAVVFTDTSTGSITNQLWNFGDGGTSSSASPSHSYTNAGTFSVSLTVFGPLGSNTLPRSNYIVATNVNPTAAFTASPTNGAAPLIVSFTDASTPSGSITNRLWNFGDGNFSSSASPTHVYTNAGTFTVSLTVRGLTGSNTLSRPALIVVSGIAKTSPVGDWEVTVRGADKGIAYLTFSNNATASGYEIRLKKFGLDTLSGTWGLTNKGKLTGSLIEQLGSATNWTGNLRGKAKTDKRIIASVHTSSNGVFRWTGTLVSSNADLSGTWSGQVTVAKASTNVEYTISLNATNSAVFDVTTTANTNTVIGQFIETSKDAITGYILISTNQATLSGKFKEHKSTILLNGKTLDDGHKVKLRLIKQ